MKKLAKKPENSRKGTGKFKPGESGNPAGRAKGSKNKRTLEVMDLCEKKKFKPIEFLIDVAKDENEEMVYRLKAAIEVNGCINPKLKAIEHSGDVGGPVQDKIVLEIIPVKKVENV